MSWLPPRVVGDPPVLSFSLDGAELQPDGSYRLLLSDHEFAWLFRSVVERAVPIMHLHQSRARPGELGTSTGATVMHDAKGRELKVGDTVLIPAKVTALYATEDYCNVQAKSVLGRRPDGASETLSAINTGVMLRANPGDENDLSDLSRS